MGRVHHPRKYEALRAVVFCILFGIGLIAAIGGLFWYWNHNDFMPDAHPANPVETKP